MRNETSTSYPPPGKMRCDTNLLLDRTKPLCTDNNLPFYQIFQENRLGKIML